MIPLMNHTHDTLLRGLMKPSDLVQKCVDIGCAAVAITDTSLGGTYDFVSACKKKIKPIIGCDFRIKGNIDANILLIAKNHNGWMSLVKATSRANYDDVYDLVNDSPKLDLDRLSMYNDGLLAITGYLGSQLAKTILGNEILAFYANESDIKQNANKNWLADSEHLISEYKEIYKHLFLAIETNSRPIYKVLNEGIRYLAKRTNTPCVAIHNTFYSNKEDAADQRILLCTKYRCALPAIDTHLAKDNDIYSHCLGKTNEHFINTENLNERTWTEEEIANTKLISDMCESYDITRKPLLPHFPCECSEFDFLKNLIEKGWQKKKSKFVESDSVYRNRIDVEMAVFQKANLSGYFLIVQDYANWCRNQGWLLGAGRGSVGGSLVAYLIGITNIDPIKYDLLFERFYNEGRNTEGNISLPDIDLDFPVEKRGEVLKYLKSKYGSEKVSQMCTFGTMKGRGAIKEVLSAHNTCSFAEMNNITQYIPDEAAISDQLVEMDEPSIVKWALINNKKELMDWVELKEDGSCVGTYGKFFEQAIRLEDTKKATSKHAGGVIIGSTRLDHTFPMIRDKSGDGLVVGVDMIGCEAMGGVKLDILGVAALDKIMGIQELLLKYD